MLELHSTLLSLWSGSALKVLVDKADYQFFMIVLQIIINV